MERVATWCVFGEPRWSAAGELFHAVQDIVQAHVAGYEVAENRFTVKPNVDPAIDESECL